MTKKSTDAEPISSTLFQDGLPAVNTPLDWPEDKILDMEAKSLIDSLPEEVRPIQLPEKFPRICNKIAELWNDPKLAISFFDELLIDNRGDRKGFPLFIITEISKLKEHFLVSYEPHKLDIWKNNRKLL
ncbi:MAG: hypothetical protein GY792_17605 [Gammaproteobacteria bacterium]|nr:hypothetical protein [Gammaproteobacteria bacterium]